MYKRISRHKDRLLASLCCSRVRRPPPLSVFLHHFFRRLFIINFRAKTSLTDCLWGINPTPAYVESKSFSPPGSTFELPAQPLAFVVPYGSLLPNLLPRHYLIYSLIKMQLVILASLIGAASAFAPATTGGMFGVLSSLEMQEVQRLTYIDIDLGSTTTIN